MHCCPHDNKLGELDPLTTYSLSCLFSHVVKYDEQENVAVSPAEKTEVTRNRKIIIFFTRAIADWLHQKQRTAMLNFITKWNSHSESGVFILKSFLR